MKQRWTMGAKLFLLINCVWKCIP